MVTIERCNGGNGFKMSFTPPCMGCRGHGVIARGLKEVNHAVQHYMGASEGRFHDGKRKHCPLCDLIRSETKKTDAMFKKIIGK